MAFTAACPPGLSIMGIGQCQSKFVTKIEYMYLQSMIAKITKSREKNRSNVLLLSMKLQVVYI